ncbi:MAG: transcriptional repressor LexA [Tissierellales bacterium]|jgi:repressor LexA|nr:transcriptional repressor LexA [Tissierellales bacterium]
MYEDLSIKQLEILNYIKTFTLKQGYPPTIREIGKAVKLSSTSSVHNHLVALEEKGYIKRDSEKPRTIEILDIENNSILLKKETVDIPIIGKVTAGEPILAVENIEDTFPLPVEAVSGHDVFFLKVKGESMIDAGIMDGDLVLVSSQSYAENGDIVVALLGEEATVKRFFKEKDRVRLQPENQFMEPIYTKEVKILGKVKALYRTY